MTRVSENSNTHSLQHALGRTKGRLEDLQIKGSNLKRMNKPSDDPMGNVDLLHFRSVGVDTLQYKRNASYAKTLLGYAEAALTDLTEIVTRAKELAVAQASDFYSGEARKNVANEVIQLKKQSLAISNQRFGNRYLFAGYSTLRQPFNEAGQYSGDNGHIFLEVSKDFFVPVNLSGFEIFFNSSSSQLADEDPFTNAPDLRPTNIHNEAKIKEVLPFAKDEQSKKTLARDLASVDDSGNIGASEYFKDKQTIFEQLQIFSDALITNNSTVIQDLLPSLDETLNRLITIRTKVGALTSSIENAEDNLENMTVTHAEHKSTIEDADVAEVFSDITKYQNILRTSYKAGSTLLNQTLLDFLR